VATEFYGGRPLPTKRVFDLVVLTFLLLKPAVGLIKTAAPRWSSESSGVMETIGDAVQVAL
jgi:hypothetical protein